MGAINRRLVLGWLGLLCAGSQVAAAPYTVRIWQNDYIGTVLAIHFINETDFQEKFYAKVQYYHEDVCSDGKFPTPSCPYHRWTGDDAGHFKLAGNNGAKVNVVVLQYGKYKMCGWSSGWTSYAPQAKAALSTTAFVGCSKCADIPAWWDRWLIAHMVPYTLDDQQYPPWMFDSPYSPNPQVTINNNNVTGVNTSLVPPSGGIDDVNGRFIISDPGAGPEWEWFPGYGSNTNSLNVADPDSLAPLQDYFDAAWLRERSFLNDAYSNLNGMLTTLDGRLVSLNSGSALVEEAIGDATGIVHADLLQLNASVLSLAGSGSGGTGTTYNDAGLRSDLAGFRADVNGHWQSLGDNVRVWVHDAVGASVDAAKAQDEVFYQYVRDRDNAVNSAAVGVTFDDFQSVPLTPFESFTETPVLADEVGMFDSEFSSTVGKISEFGAVFDSWRLNVATMGNQLVGHWSSLGQEPVGNWSFPCGMYGTKTVDMTSFNNWWRIIRAVEVIAVWLLFLWAIMRLLKDAVA